MSLTFAGGQGVGSLVRYIEHQAMIGGPRQPPPFPLGLIGTMATPKLNTGDRVRFSSAWLRSTSSATSPVARLRGEVIEVKSLGSSNQYATVRWDYRYFDSQETTVLCSNLQRIKKP